VPKPIQDVRWNAQVRLCKRSRQLIARGENANQTVARIRGAIWATRRGVKARTVGARSLVCAGGFRLTMDGWDVPRWS
jgi:hypothetical protein